MSPAAGLSGRSTRAMEPWVDVATVAEYLSVTPGWVYEHAAELGAGRLGSGPRARLRFRLSEVDERLSACSTSRRSDDIDQDRELAPANDRARARTSRRRQRSGTSAELLPIRGRTQLREAL